ncbi:MAG: trypsin-like serine protease [Solirubrobacterales bacterium]
MFSRIGRVGTVALCACALVGALSASSAGASPRAGKSVIGGAPANIDQWSFAAAVLTPTTLCTGTVISPTRVLTAGHCVGNPLTMMVRTRSSSAFTGGEALAVSSVAYAPGFSHTFENDLAILTLKTPTTATPIQIADAAEDAAYTRAGAPLSEAGFGNRNPLIVGKRKIGLLTATTVRARSCPLPTWAICDAGRKVGFAARKIKRKVKRRTVRASICSGDSGGPLVANTPEGPRLVGTAEASTAPPSKRNPFFFVICGLKGYPSVHTRAYSYSDFIQANLGP